MLKAIALILCFVPVMPVMAADLTVTDAWIRLLPGDLPLGGYFALHNGGTRAVKLLGVSSPAFREVQMHKSVEVNGIESMDSVSDITVMPGASLRFAPGAYHLMLFGRTQPLKIGDKVPVTLKLSGKPAEMTVIFLVRKATGE